MEVIVHRGMGTKNSVMGIYSALFVSDLNPSGVHWCEMDVLWDGTRWMVCHDFHTLRDNSIKQRHVPFLDLVNVLRGSSSEKKRECHVLLIDIKWDWVHNQSHHWGKAWASLHPLVTSVAQVCTPWLQFNHKFQLKKIFKERIEYPIGLALHQPIMGAMMDLSSVNFLTVNVGAFSPQDYENLCDWYPGMTIIGYTCTDIHCFEAYTHLGQHLRAMVCDVD